MAVVVYGQLTLSVLIARVNQMPNITKRFMVFGICGIFLSENSDARTLGTSGIWSIT